MWWGRGGKGRVKGWKIWYLEGTGGGGLAEQMMMLRLVYGSICMRTTNNIMLNLILKIIVVLG